MREMRGEEVPAYPVQNRLTQPMRAAATAAGETDLMSLWAGQGVALATPGSTADKMRIWWAEAREAAANVRARGSEQR